MNLLSSDIHGVASVEVYDQPREMYGTPQLRKDIYINLKDGSEIVIYCYMGAIKEGGK